MLEEAVRGFAIKPNHGRFWAGANRQQFIDAMNPTITPGNASTSRLIKAVRGQGITRMPMERPPIPESRIGYMETWINAGAPDSNPPYAGLISERDPRPEGTAPPSPVAVPSFAGQIRPLFRDSDISCMIAIADFDLSKYDDVKANAAAIFARLDSGSMPTDGRWPQADIDLFKAWMNGGFSA